MQKYFILFLVLFSSCAFINAYEKEDKVSSKEKKICGKYFCSHLSTNEETYLVVVKTIEEKLLQDEKVELSAECLKRSVYTKQPVHLRRIQPTVKPLEISKQENGTWNILKDLVSKDCELHFKITHKKHTENHYFGKIK
jgi:hypothetical protein